MNRKRPRVRSHTQLNWPSASALRVLTSQRTLAGLPSRHRPSCRAPTKRLMRTGRLELCIISANALIEADREREVGSVVGISLSITNCPDPARSHHSQHFGTAAYSPNTFPWFRSIHVQGGIGSVQAHLQLDGTAARTFSADREERAPRCHNRRLPLSRLTRLPWA